MTSEIQHFKSYLQTRQLKPRSIQSYLNNLQPFITWLNDTQKQAEDITYTDLLEYVETGREQGLKTDHLARQLSVIRHYYNYLKYNGRITSNPAADFYLKGRKKRIPHDLLTPDQLEALYNDFEEKGLSARRDKVMLGLMIYQGVKTNELQIMQAHHLKLREGKIQIPGTATSQKRVLKLEAHQMIALQEYQTKTRELLLALTEKQTDKLFVTSGKGTHLNNAIYYMLRALRVKHPYFINAQQLRQSRIAIWTHQYDIRQAQYLAGHKYVSSTERYRKTNMQNLQKELKKHHPLR